MKTYYYQIFEEGKPWEAIGPKKHEFSSRRKAMSFGEELANLFKREIRLTEENVRTGVIISPK